MRRELFYTYMVASRTRVLYIGMTGDLRRRMFEHRLGEGVGFTALFRCSRLVWFEAHPEVLYAIRREKELKGWTRMKKVALIEADNCSWEDLSVALFDLKPQGRM